MAGSVGYSFINQCANRNIFRDRRLTNRNVESKLLCKNWHGSASKIFYTRCPARINNYRTQWNSGLRLERDNPINCPGYYHTTPPNRCDLTTNSTVIRNCRCHRTELKHLVRLGRRYLPNFRLSPFQSDQIQQPVNQQSCKLYKRTLGSVTVVLLLLPEKARSTNILRDGMDE